jgi:streptogramin lyase
MLTSKVVLVMIVALVIAPVPVKAVDAPAELTGMVSSPTEGRMEGVLVSAKREGSTITTTVVTDKDGQYVFPSNRLQAGKYNLITRAAGYDPAVISSIALTSGTAKQQNIRLIKTKNLIPQIVWSEFLNSVPGTQTQKDELYNCVGCHAAAPVMQSTYDVNGWMTTINRMRNWAPSSSLINPQLLPYHADPRPGDAEFAKWLSTVNLGAGRTKLAYQLKSMLRPKAKATKVIVTEYDLPRTHAEPHDVVVDDEGNFWYDDFAEPVIGYLDAKTGQAKEWKLPIIKEGVPPGSLCLALDGDGNPWVARAYQGGITKFDKKTKTATNFSEPPEYNNPQSRTTFLAPTPDGKVWFADTHNLRMNLLDPSSGRIESFAAYPDMNITYAGAGTRGPSSQGRHSMYGIAADSHGVGYWADIAGGSVGEVDPNSGKVHIYSTPTPNSGVRRVHMDWEDKLWFGENYSDKIGTFDTHTKQITEWADPTPWDAPYDVVRDKSDHVWTGSWSTDLATRLDLKTGETIQYLLPTVDTNIRRVEVNNLTTPPSFVVGENHHAKILVVEPLE